MFQRGGSTSDKGMNGPKPTSAISRDAATQLHRTGHSCIEPFLGPSGGKADKADVPARRAIGCNGLAMPRRIKSHPLGGVV